MVPSVAEAEQHRPTLKARSNRRLGSAGFEHSANADRARPTTERLRTDFPFDGRHRARSAARRSATRSRARTSGAQSDSNRGLPGHAGRRSPAGQRRAALQRQRDPQRESRTSVELQFYASWRHRAPTLQSRGYGRDRASEDASAWLSANHRERRSSARGLQQRSRREAARSGRRR